ncbi:MAG: tRNA pseudouridine(55) synthase TruB [Proteobacteria bacterium]|nr:tRNA pseudouridine(55) synthase TruB [Pseudomonadota bacterium]MBU1685977.1 tRNA pseudouridine(55) synthase TruB [Pseudomonadota bacterium]
MITEIPLPQDIPEIGVYLVDKPVGPSSFRMVQLVRRAIGIKKTGHAGTLDPFASGLLVICAGRPATKLISSLMGGPKEYEATVSLGVETDTQDTEGRVTATRPVEQFSRETIETCLAGFVGEIAQTPPLYSALKHGGKPLYYYARKGIEIERQPRPVVIYGLECIDLGPTWFTIRVRCGKGTYIRTLAADLGTALGCGAHLNSLRRTRSGFFSVDEAVAGEALSDVPSARAVLLSQRRSVEEVLMKINSSSAKV